MGRGTGSDITISTIWCAAGSAGGVYVGIPMLLFDTTEPLQACERAWKKDERFNVTWGSWEAISRTQTGIFSINNWQNRLIFETGVENTDIGVGILRGGNKSSGRSLRVQVVHSILRTVRSRRRVLTYSKSLSKQLQIQTESRQKEET